MNSPKRPLVMDIRSRSGERGLALLIVLWIIVAASLVVSAFNATVRSGTTLASSEVQLARSEALLDAGAEIAVSRLIDEEKGRRWRPDGKSHVVPFEDAELIISIRDANGLIDINKADKELLLRFLRQFAGSESNALRLRDRIVQARGKGAVEKPADREHGNEGESEDEPPPAVPFIDIAQLRGLEGMTMELYKQIAPFITVYGKDGRIGPLSAPDEVLLSIPGITRNDIDRLRSSMGTRKETERAIEDLSRHVGAYLVDEPGPGYVVSVGVHRSDDKFASGKVYVVAMGIDSDAPYRLISKRPLGSAQLTKKAR
jgi:general secretion pathway protein K